MEREDLLRHLAGWRDGIDPATGGMLPPDHPAHRVDFLRVVCATIDALGAGMPPSARSATIADGRANAGRPWSAAEDELLAQAHGAGMGIAELSRARTSARPARSPRAS